MLPCINPAAAVSVADFGGGDGCVIVDDFLLNPGELVELARQSRERFATKPANAYPGLEFTLPAVLAAPIDAFFLDHVRERFGASRALLATETRLAMVTTPPAQLAPRQRLCHVDEPPRDDSLVTLAGVLYLFHDAGLGGTDFYRPRPGVDLAGLSRGLAGGSLFALMARHAFFRRPAAYLTDSCEFFERIGSIPARFNRIIFYRGDLYHSGHIAHPERLTDDPATGRLTLNCFYKCRRLIA